MKKTIVDFEGTIVVDDSIWGIIKNTNMLVRMNCNDFSIKEIHRIDGEKEYLKRARPVKLFRVKEMLYIFLYGSKFYYTYNLSSNKENIQKKIFLKDMCNWHEAILFMKNEIYFLPGRGMPWINCLNVMEKDSKLLANSTSCDESHLMAMCCDCTSDTIYAVDRFANCYYKIQPDNLHIIKQDFDEKGTVFWGVKCVNYKIILIHMKEAAVTIYDTKNNTQKTITDFPENFHFDFDVLQEEGAFLSAFVYEKYIYLFPFHSNEIIRIDVDNEIVESVFEDYFEFMKENQVYWHSEIFTNAVYNNGKIYIYDVGAEGWIVFDLASMKWIFKKKVYMEIDSQLILDNVNDIISETRIYSLNGYISNLLSK